MELNKKIIAVIIAVIVIIVAVSTIFVSGFFDTPIGEVTPFDNNFASGEFMGNVTLENSTNQWSVAYSDKENQIEYNMSTCKNASLIVDMYVIEGMDGPEHRTFNNNEWDIYYAEGTSDSGEGDKIDVYMCVANQGEQSYIIYTIFYNTTRTESSGGVYSEGYGNYIEPLLDSITLKENPNAPTIYEALEIDQGTYQQYVHLVDQVKKGNQTAIQQLLG